MSFLHRHRILSLLDIIKVPLTAERTVGWSIIRVFHYANDFTNYSQIMRTMRIISTNYPQPDLGSNCNFNYKLQLQITVIEDVI